MLKIGLTGGIGSGKTAVAGIFRVLGIPVFNADKEARMLMENDDELVADIRQLFGEESYINNRLNRTYIANIVFADAFNLEQLNAIVHPATIATAERWMQNQSAPYAIKEAAILFESGSAAHLDFVIGVHSPLPLRLQRVMQRDNVTPEEVMARIDRQMDESIKMKLCDFVIENDDQHLLIPQVLKLHEEFIKM